MGEKTNFIKTKNGQMKILFQLILILLATSKIFNQKLISEDCPKTNKFTIESQISSVRGTYKYFNRFYYGANNYIIRKNLEPECYKRNLRILEAFKGKSIKKLIHLK